MSQAVFTAKEAKNNFGRLLDEAQHSPVFITKNGRKFAVVLSYKDHSYFYKNYRKFKRLF